MEALLDFVTHEWQEAWFSIQMYDENIYKSLLAAIEKLKVRLLS